MSKIGAGKRIIIEATTLDYPDLGKLRGKRVTIVLVDADVVSIEAQLTGSTQDTEEVVVSASSAIISETPTP